MPDTLRHTTIRALCWSFAEGVGLQAVKFAIGIVLARLLLPEQFGLIGMLMIFTAVAQSFLDSGFGSALVQKREVVLTDTCSIFFFNILMGLLVTGALYMAAPWIAAFYGQPILIHLTRALSLTIIIDAFGLIQSALLRKHMDFRTQTKVTLIAVLLSGFIGISMAVADFGVWSLVVQLVSNSLFRATLLWILNPWRPRLIFSITALKEMFGFGSRMLASSLLNQIFENIYSLVIGKLFSPAQLGFFTRAVSLQGIPSQSLSEMVGRVTFPVFSIIQNDRVRLKKGVKKALTLLVFAEFPLMIGLAVIARPLVLLLLTEKWFESVVYLQPLCMLGLLYPLHMINLNALQALGRSDLFLRLELIKKLLVVVNIAITWRWGISAIIYGMIATSMVSYYLNSYYTERLIGYSLKEQLRDMTSYIVTSLLMGVAVYLVGIQTIHVSWPALLLQVLVGMVSYVCLCRIFRLAAFMELWQELWNGLPFRSETAS